MTETLSLKPAPPAIFRWTALIVASLAMFGNYYIYDSISPLADLLAKQLNFSDSNIGLLQGIYNVPNIFMVLIGGFIIDRIGTKKSALIFSILCLLGAFITILKGNLFWMATGRLVFGLGAESLIVAVTTIIARWFKGKELSFAFGLNLTISRLGTFLALNSPSWGAEFYHKWSGPLWITIVFGVLSVSAVVLYFIIDKIGESRYSLAKEGNQDKIVISQFFRFGKSFWFITLLCVTFYSAIFPFQTFAVKFFIDKHLMAVHNDVARAMGGVLSSVLIVIAMILTPIFGLLADKIGKRGTLMIIGSILLMPVYLIMAYVFVQAEIPASLSEQANAYLNASGGVFSQIWNWLRFFLSSISILFQYYPNVIIPMLIMGISFSLIPAVMWPSVAIVVDNSKLGTAYGLMTMIQNVGVLCLNLIIGYMNDVSHDYTAGMWIFSSLGIFGFIFALLLKKAESGPSGHGLESVSKT